MSEECLFCNYEKFELVAENSHCYAIRDKHPITALHMLILSKTHYKNIFELPAFELISIFELAKHCRNEILKKDSSVKGFNFGSNSGAEAGQKIFHVHFHLIPRRAGDIAPSPAIQ